MTEVITAVTGNDTLNTMRVTNPELSRSTDFTLSDAAKSTLDMIGKMQGDYNREISAARDVSSGAQSPQIKADGASPDMPADRMVAAAELMGRQIDASARVQEQLAKFVMASSVSSSFGRDLNMFLRGQ